MKLEVRNSEETYELSNNFIPQLSPYRRRIKMIQRFGVPGGQQVGDEQADSRDLRLRYRHTGDNDSDYITELQSILGVFRLDKAPFYLVDKDNARRCEVRLQDMDDQPVADGLTFRIGDTGLTLKMLDGHWEDLTESLYSSPTGGSANDSSILVSNDADVNAYPIIEITPERSNSEFTLRNLTNGNFIKLSSASFVVGTTFTIDAVTGRIELDDGITSVELSSALADGSGMINLVPGNNLIRYESVFGDCDITIRFRRRYAF